LRERRFLRLLLLRVIHEEALVEARQEHFTIILLVRQDGQEAIRLRTLADADLINFVELLLAYEMRVLFS